MFHVPELSRLREGPMHSTSHAGNNGAFLLLSKTTEHDLWIIASDGLGWEHVSVHAANARNKLFVPCWHDMCYLKDVFWDQEDVVMQLHPRSSEYVNMHASTLHLWRPIGQEIPTPHSILVGLRLKG